MPLFENNQPNQTAKQQSTNQPNNTLNNQPSNQKPNNLVTTLGSLLPFAPLLFEQFTGQKIPQISGTIAEMQTALIQINSNLQTIAQNQQQLAQRLIALEQNANQHLTNLTNQFNSLRLTHTKERKEIAYNQPNSD